jgi:acylphosphatase
MAEPARRVLVTGRVQGVFFRAWTQQQANALGVNGWVCNCPDGSVEAHLEGDEAAMKALIQRMHQGPPAAEVQGVDVEEAPALGITGFKARR